MELALRRARQLLLTSQLLGAAYLLIISGLLLLDGSPGESLPLVVALGLLVALYVLERTEKISTAESAWYSLGVGAFSVVVAFAGAQETIDEESTALLSFAIPGAGLVAAGVCARFGTRWPRVGVGSLAALVAIAATWVSHALYGLRDAQSDWALDPSTLWTQWQTATGPWTDAQGAGSIALLVIGIAGLLAPERGRWSTTARWVVIGAALLLGVAAGLGWGVAPGWTNYVVE